MIKASVMKGLRENFIFCAVSFVLWWKTSNVKAWYNDWNIIWNIHLANEFKNFWNAMYFWKFLQSHSYSPHDDFCCNATLGILFLENMLAVSKQMESVSKSTIMNLDHWVKLQLFTLSKKCENTIFTVQYFPV